MALIEELAKIERTREAARRAGPITAARGLRWRANVVRHTFHILPGQSILELGAGSGLWTEHLVEVLRGENPVSGVTFDAELADVASARRLPGARVLSVRDLSAVAQSGPYDYVVGDHCLGHDEYAEVLELLQSVLKPGGQMLLFEANRWNPRARLAVGRRKVLRKYRLMQTASEHGFVDIQLTPYDLVSPGLPTSVLRLAYLIEQLPVLKELSECVIISARRPAGGEGRPAVDLAVHASLHGAVSVVVPCHNEAMNIGKLVDALTGLYDRYLYEILVVDDNSTDDTASVADALTRRDPRVRVIRRSPPPGVGRALRDGYAEARGRYVLSLDCDFYPLAPELRDLFDAIAEGHDGAYGSRFSRESILRNYPPLKMLGNRAFHLVLRRVLRQPVWDVTNNLKLLRADVAAALEIDEDGFAANAETGVRPVLAGYDIKEVPISWVGRTAAMGTSSFRTVRVAPGYMRVLLRLLRPNGAPVIPRLWWSRRPAPRPPARRGSGRANE
jgi:dolichol-phosphate mannosyltransferase